MSCAQCRQYITLHKNLRPVSDPKMLQGYTESCQRCANYCRQEAGRGNKMTACDEIYKYEKLSRLEFQRMIKKQRGKAIAMASHLPGQTGARLMEKALPAAPSHKPVMTKPLQLPPAPTGPLPKFQAVKPAAKPAVALVRVPSQRYKNPEFSTLSLQTLTARGGKPSLDAMKAEAEKIWATGFRSGSAKTLTAVKKNKADLGAYIYTYYKK